MVDVDGLFDEQAETQRQTINRLNRQIVKERDRTEAILDAVKTAVSDGLAGLEIPPVTPPKPDRRSKGEEIAVALWSDWQLGKRTPSYSSEVCEERVLRFVEKASRILEIQRADHPVKRIAVFLLGDMIEGELIFPGQAHEVDSSLYQQVTIDGPRILGQGIRWAASEFEQVDVYCVPGNHGYLGGRARKEMHPESNGDRMLYQFVSQLTADLVNVTWHVSIDWFQIADLGADCRFFLCHGDNVRGHAGIPWYGWQRAVQSMSMMNRIWGIEFDYLAAGHFHTPVSIYINGVTYWINGSTESHNPYALRQLNAAGEPTQWLLFCKAGQGVTSEYRIDLS